ncbi:hypothetical protein K439DRAFT_1631137 [Ramaria rubella]|nr:hypothetical protein K439DRAFT_1631137 [Ramaria rubella]
MFLPATEIPSFLAIEDSVIYNTIAASSFYFWDQCITFGMEKELIWQKKISAVNVLFYILRYMTMAIRIVELLIYTNVSGLLHLSTGICTAWVYFEAIAGYLVFLAVEILLVMRIYAFYGKGKRVLVFMLILLALEHAACITLLVLGLPNFDITPSPFPSNIHVGACIVVKLTALFPNYWIPGLGFETVLFVLLVIKFVLEKRSGTGGSHLLIIFVRDGAWAFAIIFAMLLWSTLAFELNPQKGEVALTWLLTGLGFCGSRLILNLRAAARDASLATRDMSVPMNVLHSGSNEMDHARPPSFHIGPHHYFKTNFLEIDSDDTEEQQTNGVEV